MPPPGAIPVGTKKRTREKLNLAWKMKPRVSSIVTLGRSVISSIIRNLKPDSEIGLERID